MVDERKLLLQIKKRDKGAINTAIDVYTPYISTVLYNVAGNSLPKEDIEEIISDVFISLWEKAECLDAEKYSIRPYIAVCARNFALKRLAKIREFADINDIELVCDRDFIEDNLISHLFGKQLWNLASQTMKFLFVAINLVRKLKKFLMQQG